MNHVIFSIFFLQLSPLRAYHLELSTLQTSPFLGFFYREIGQFHLRITS